MNENQGRQANYTPRIGGDAKSLAFQKARIVFDADSIRSVGFRVFANSWRTLSPPIMCYIPGFEYADLSGDAKSLVDALVTERRLSILNCGRKTDYTEIYNRLSAMQARSVAMVIGDSAKTCGIVSDAKSFSFTIQACQLNDRGMISPRFNPSRNTNENSFSEEISSSKGFSVTTQPEAIRIVAMSRRIPLGIRSTVYTSKGVPVVLTSEAMVNSDSITYATNQPGLWAKIFATKSLNTLIEEKCKRMLSKEIQFDGLCWPKDLLRDADGTFAGLLIPDASGIPLSLCVFKGVESGIRKYFPSWDKRHLTRLTETILKKVLYMHSMGILFGCLNPATILVKNESTVYFVDTAHYQIDGFPCMIRNTMFTPPELQEKLRQGKIYLCNRENEKYAIALLVFMLLMPGKMPYAIEDSLHAPEAIMQQRFAFSYKGEHGSNRSVGSWRFVWSHLTPFKEPFYRTFQSGESLNQPEKRPSDNRWLTLVSDYLRELEGNQLYDPNTRELVPKSFRRSSSNVFVRCKFCNIEHPKSYFDGRYFDDYQICKSCLGEPSNVSFLCVDCGRTFTYTNETAIFHARMRERDDSWRNQKHCRDCKNKTAKCQCCGKVVPVFRISRMSGYCSDCSKNSVYTTRRCQDCNRPFDITVVEHEFHAGKGQTDPVRCKPCREAKKRTRY